MSKRIGRTVRIESTTSIVSNSKDDDDDDVHYEDDNRRSSQTGRMSLFHKNTIAFSPDPDDIPAEIDALANLPPPSQVRRGTNELSAPIHLPWTHPQPLTAHESRESIDVSKQRPSLVKQGKLQLPPPYRRHRAEIDKRRAKRDFIYGRDEEYQFSERDNRVKASCCGVLYFHTIEMLNLVVNRQSFVDNIPVSYYCNISIGTTKRTTKIVHSKDSHQIKMDSGVHLGIEVSEWREAPSNRLRLELWSFQDPEAHFIVGTVEIHIYNFIRLQHVIDLTHLWSDGIKVGKLAYEAAFSYGTFGYGHSNQLLNFSQPLMETISHSMFPRIKLDEDADLADKVYQARKPENLKMFTYHSFILEMDDMNNQHISAIFGRPRVNNDKHIKLEPKPMIAQQVEFVDGFPVHCKLHMNIFQTLLQADFNDMYGEYVCIGHKRERLEYLTNMVQGRMRDMYQQEAGPIFEHLDERELDKIHRTETLPGEILYPKKTMCPYSEPYQLASGDEKFQDEFPAVRREPGFLARLFGYERKPEADEYLNDMDYPAFKDAKLPEMKNVTVRNCTGLFINWLKRTFLRVKAFGVKLWGFIFPEIMHDLPVPHISLTVATPEGSTTNIYSYFAREGKDLNSNRKVDRLVKQTTALIGMTRKPNKRDKLKARDKEGADSQMTSSSDTDDEEKLKRELQG